ncbi:SusC/RagA family TonB-linked outer membrane protein [Ekhidna sp. To15]|uniref:SusC/RagA family TonB-linked outer membrane protein n=1 Tax=Ekhidna sp. To15 TaxID=3395267 RepID=UPI003F523F04
MRKCLRYGFAFTFLILALTGWAQRSVSGKVTDETGEGLPGVNVVIKGTNTGTTTDIDGNYRIEVNENQVLVFSFVGFDAQEINTGTRSVIDVSLGGATELQEVVVTGVSQGTSAKKLGFALTKVDEDQLSEVTQLDAANALRGKVAGVQIVQQSGVPGTAASINLRGTTTISGSSTQPLIIVDGIITPPGSAGLADINMNDVESIEVLKGAAGASLYGSLAGNGVIQIITKKGSKEYGKTDITFKSEYGTNEVLRKVDLSKSHAFQLNPDGTYALDVNGQRIPDTEQIIDNPYPQLFDQQDVTFPGRSFHNNYLSVGSTTEKTNFYGSFDNLRNEGLVPGQPAYTRQSVKANIGHQVSDKIDVTLSANYIGSKGTNPQEGGQTGFIYGALLSEPDIDLTAPNPDGQPFITVSRPIGNFTNANNPLYVAHNNFREFERNRVLLGTSAKYQILDWWGLEGQVTFDRTEGRSHIINDQKYLAQGNPTGTGGFISRNAFDNSARVFTFSSNFNKTFGDFNTALTLRYVGEQYLTSSFSTAGNNVQAAGIFQLDNVDRTTLGATSSETTFRADNYMTNLRFDYKDKIIFDGLFRVDRSSLFGPEQRDVNFYRASLAYRLTEDLSINGIQEWKIRGSVGTSGVRPQFQAQYETLSVSGGVVGFNILGNRNLSPTVVTEIELGTNVSFLNRLNLEFNYAKSTADDQILLVPLPKNEGFQAQFRNAGSMESNTIELALGAEILKGDVTWDAGITYSRSRTRVNSIDRPKYFLSAFNGTNSFLIDDGVQLGEIWGNRMAESTGELTVDEDGFVDNLAGLAAGTYTPSDFEVNDEGYLILSGSQYTDQEVAYHLLDEDGARLVTKLGDTNPDALLGFTSSVGYKGFKLFVSMDAQIGGDIANIMRQNLIFNTRGAEVDQAGRPEGQRHWDSYMQSTSNSGNGLNQRFVESAEYIALREMSLSYTFGNDLLSTIGVGEVVKDIKLSLIGRNLFMITDYKGFTPDISSTGSVAAGNVDQDVLLNPTLFRADAYGYPMFRSYSAVVQIRF